MQKKIKIRASVLILIIILLCAVSVFIALPHVLHRGTAYTAYVYKDGLLIQTIPLAAENVPFRILIGDYADTYNLIEVSGDSIRIAEASCPDHICVWQGYINNSLIPITCLPNHVVIELKSDTSPTDNLDAVTH